ncbi:hypothetical protein ACFQZO_23285 [Bradyrhizobium sp. GCM10027634]|uniref:hypothetical protein n=1 Tax=unclassified Bradyrhizobium TaxID=2631580 RepID=UPI00188DACB7|nr:MULTISPECIES: hypothetical protein [unclassified Bradyrhizobium]MDN5003764.1 hypothetical protein [Bradyrhizobium sp. WYCCWR 12677]QOZ47712.1 hypothetical protein XH89_32695 [Bradyrhizobium sp. CCBAU 53340]
MDVRKLLWGIVLAILFLCFLGAFIRRASRAQGVKYNWFGVLLSFSTIGLALYLVFFRQL